MKNQKLFILLILAALFSIDVHVQAQITTGHFLKITSNTNPGRDYQIVCGGRQDVFANNDLVTHAGGHAEFRVAESGGSNRGLIITDGVSGTTFFYAHAQTQQIGIGVSGNTPKSKLHVKGGDIYIEDIGNGVIMKSPDGNCWRLIVNNSGIPGFTALVCP